MGSEERQIILPPQNRLYECNHQPPITSSI